MFTISPEIRERLDEPEKAEQLIAKYLSRYTPKHQQAFADRAKKLLEIAAKAKHKISLSTLDIELEAIAQTMAGRPEARATGTVGHGSDDDLSSSFDDKDSTFFDPPSWRGENTHS